MPGDICLRQKKQGEWMLSDRQSEDQSVENRRSHTRSET